MLGDRYSEYEIRSPRRRCAAYFQRTAPWFRAPLCVLGDRYSEYEMRSSPPSLRCLLPAYRPLVPSTIMRARRQVQRVRDEKFPSVYSSPQSSDAPTNASVPERQHLDWSPVFINPVYRSSSRKIARTTTGPAAYAPLLVQHAISLGACSQEAEGQAGKIFHSRRSCQHTTPFLCNAH